MNLERLDYIKSVNNHSGDWSYEAYRKGSHFPLNFKQGPGVEAHVAKLPAGALILLSQTYQDKRYLSHVVEIVNDATEDQPQWEDSDWGIVRWVKVIWAVEPSRAPLDADVLQVNWGYFDTKAKSIEGPNLIKHWKTPAALKAHVLTALVEAEKRQLTLA